MKTSIRLRYKGKRATVEISWESTPFECIPSFKGDPEVLGAYMQELEALPGYFIRRVSVFNLEAHLNAASSAARLFPGFTHSVTPPIDLSLYLSPKDKDPNKVY